jgi:putative transposase
LTSGPERFDHPLKNKKISHGLYNAQGGLESFCLEHCTTMSDLYNSLSHSKWDCKYRIVFVPKCRRKTLYGKVRHELGSIFHALARQKECQIVKGHVMPDHVHMCVLIPPKYAVASVIGFLKGKSAIAIARQFWARGYAVSTIGFELEAIRRYIREQEGADASREGNF